MPQITITLTDEEYQKYLDGLAQARALEYDRKKILIVFNSPGCRIPMIKAALPDLVEPLLEGRSKGHRRFYREAMQELNQLLSK